jgi:hypothetical protein
MRQAERARATVIKPAQKTFWGGTKPCPSGMMSGLGSEAARAAGGFSDDGRMLTAHHERSDDGEHWIPPMTVVLRKIE